MSENDPTVRANQVYRKCLNAKYALEYYREIYRQSSLLSKAFDMTIAFGTLGSGGTGLGVLAGADLAWIWGILSAASVLLAAAKNVYNWTNTTETTLQKVTGYAKLASDYSNLVEDINYHKTWDDKLQARLDKLREDEIEIGDSTFPNLGKKKQIEIQARIKAQTGYENWWSFTRQPMEGKA